MADQQIALNDLICDLFEEETEENVADDDDYLAVQISRSPPKLRLV